MSSDIVKRLAREHDFRVFTASDDLPGITMMTEAERRQEAADEIERLRAVLDVIDAQVAAYMNGSIGSSRAIQTISLLLDAVEARRG